MEPNDAWRLSAPQNQPVAQPNASDVAMYNAVSRTSSNLRAQIKRMVTMLNTIDAALARVDTHWNDPVWRDMVAVLVPRLNAVEGVFWGHLNELKPYMKHLAKGRQVRLGGAADIVVRSVNDTYPGKAIQLKTTGGAMPAEVKTHLTKGFLQACGVTRENPGNLRRIVQVILRGGDVYWPFTNSGNTVANTLLATATEKINEAYITAVGDISFTPAVYAAMSGGTVDLQVPANGRKHLRQVLGRQYVGGAKKFEAVVTKILYENPHVLTFGGNTSIDVAKLVFVTTIVPRHRDAVMTTQCVEMIGRDGSRYNQPGTSVSRSFPPPVVHTQQQTLDMLAAFLAEKRGQ